EGFVGNGLPEKDVFYYHPDHLGSSSYISTLNGQISQHVEYIAFGEVLFEEHSSSFKSPYLFNGKELDRETNLTNFGARYLDMKTSLWLNVDPLAEKYPNISPYVYCANNPVLYIDPDGREIGISELMKSASHAKAFILFAKTKEGKAFLNNYASAGQKLEYNGVVFYQADKAGKYDKKGVDLNYKLGKNESGSSTSSEETNNGINVNINIAKKGFGSDNLTFNLTEAITHESFLHANSSADDRLDDGMNNNSNLPKEYQSYGNHADHYYIGREFLANPANKDVQQFPVGGFNLLKSVSKQLKLNFSDIKIKSIMWDYNGSYLKTNQNTGKLEFKN
ncbi:RHS repeat domain-containing protein, partial [Flavobacterium psychrophilum]